MSSSAPKPSPAASRGREAQDASEPRSGERPAPPLTVPGEMTAAFFDVDNTILRGTSLFQIGLGLYRWGLLSPRDILMMVRLNLRYVWFGESAADVDAARTRSLETIRGHPVAQIVAIAEQVWGQVLAGRVYPGTKALLDQHLAEGHEVWLVSASPRVVADLVAARVGATGALGTILEAEDGVLTGRLVGGLLHGPAKAEAVNLLAQERGISLDASYAYGDSANDIPMLSEVGHPVGINPDGRLRRYCRDRRWPIREFRDRQRAVKSSLRGAARMGAVWAAWVIAKWLFKRASAPRGARSTGPPRPS